MCFVWISEQTAIISLYSINCLLSAVLWATRRVCAPILVPLIACRWQRSCPRVAIKNYVACRRSPSSGWKDLLYTAAEKGAKRILAACLCIASEQTLIRHHVLLLPPLSAKDLVLCLVEGSRMSACQSATSECAIALHDEGSRACHVQPGIVNVRCKNVFTFFEATQNKFPCFQDKLRTVHGQCLASGTV